MLIPTLIDHPEIIGAVLRGTPTWVWVLLAALVWLGFTQVRDREASLVRVSVMPLVMTGFAIFGMVSAFGSSPMFGYDMLAWMLTAAVMFAAIGTTNPPAGTQFHPATRSFRLPGSWIPLALIVAVFLTRYVVNVDLAMQPALARDGQYTLIVSALYGLTSGMFIGRAARLWRLAIERIGFGGAVMQRDPW
jgi:hypothetical protein